MVTLKVYAFDCGWLTGDRGGFIAGESGSIRVPVPAFFIEHPKGRAVFDTGLHPDTAVDAGSRLGFLANLFEVHLGPGDDLASRLRGLGADPSSVDVAILSHLHFDHAGGLALLPNARVLVQDKEWAAGADDEVVARNAFLPGDYRLGHDIVAVNGEYDVFGDGRVVCLPTEGHTPGHQSLRLRLDDGRQVVLCADACYLRRNLEELVLPSVVYDRDAMLASLRRLDALRRLGCDLVFGHEPDGWESVARSLTS